MNKDEAIKFLKNNQPLPDDNKLTEDLIKIYDEVRKYFFKNPAKECIPLFLNSFGLGDGLGTYQLIEDVIKKYNHDDVVPHIAKSLYSDYESICYWNTQIASLFPDVNLVEPLARLLNHKSFDIRYSCITALEQIGGDKVIKILRFHLKIEEDTEIKDLITEIIEEAS